MSAEQPITWKHLAPKPGSHYRQMFVKGTRIAARVLYGYYTPGDGWPGQSVEDLAAGFDLPVEAVREAIAYCETDPPETRDDLKREEALMEAIGGNDSAPLSPQDYARIFLQ